MFDGSDRTGIAVAGCCDDATIAGMGLTIHYSLKAGVRTFEQAKALVRDIHAAASEWPFDYVGPVIDVPEGTILPDFPPGPPMSAGMFLAE